MDLKQGTLGIWKLEGSQRGEDLEMLMSGRAVLVGTFLFWRKVFHISHHGSFWKPNIQETPLSTLVFQGVSCICILKLHMDDPDVQPGLKSLCAPETLTCLQIPWGCFLKLGSDSRGLGRPESLHFSQVPWQCRRCPSLGHIWNIEGGKKSNIIWTTKLVKQSMCVFWQSEIHRASPVMKWKEQVQNSAAGHSEIP